MGIKVIKEGKNNNKLMSKEITIWQDTQTEVPQ
jgi:hypothetical protein